MPTREQFTQLAQLHMDSIFRLAFSSLKSRADADDVTQTVLLRLWEREKPFESDDHLRYWLVRVTLNECRKHWRSPWRRTEDFARYAATLAFDQPHDGEVFDAVMALDKKYRVAVFLHYYEGYSIAEIARLLNIPVGTVGTRLARARGKLKLILSEEELT